VKKKNLILHVGLPKTGSTALQTYLDSNRELLATKSFNYPKERTKKGIPKHQSLVKGLNTNNHTKLKVYLKNNTKNNLILSTEGLTNHIYDFSSKSILEFRETIKTYNVIIVLVTRDFDSWVKSYYAQSVINPRIKLSYNATSLEIDEFKKHPRILQLANITRLTKDLRKAFEVNDLIRIEYSNNLVKDFCKIFKIPYNKMNTRMINQSPKPWAIELIRQINSFGTSEKERIRWKSTIQEFSQSNHSLMKDYLNDSNNQGEKLNKSILDKLVYNKKTSFCLEKRKLEKFKKFIYLNKK